MPAGLRSLRWHILLAFGIILISGVLWSNREPLRNSSQRLLSTWMPSDFTTDVPSIITSTDDESFAYDLSKQSYQEPLDGYSVIPYDTASLRRYNPINFKGPGLDTFATFYSTRDATAHDPYFISVQQIIYRLLWDPVLRQNKYPVTVFVTPFVSEEQRDVFCAAGALVRELPLVSFQPDSPGVPARLQDTFSKVEMWRQTDFSRIAYLDADALPVKNIDDIFESAPWRACKEYMLPQEDRQVWPEICNYSFATYVEPDTEFNAGVMVLGPNQPMYDRLIRLIEDHDFEDDGSPDQSFFNWAYHEWGAFPPSPLPRVYNGGENPSNDGLSASIVHGKLWATQASSKDAGERLMFERKWTEMLEWYGSDEFLKLRKLEGLQ